MINAVNNLSQWVNNMPSDAIAVKVIAVIPVVSNIFLYLREIELARDPLNKAKILNLLEICNEFTLWGMIPLLWFAPLLAYFFPNRLVKVAILTVFVISYLHPLWIGQKMCCRLENKR